MNYLIVVFINKNILIWVGIYDMCDMNKYFLWESFFFNIIYYNYIYIVIIFEYMYVRN